MHSTVAVDVRAPATLVFELARDVERWPALLPHYVGTTVLARHAAGAVTARMVAIRSVVPVIGFGVPVAWRSRVWAEEDALQLRFVHLGGATDGMDVTWRLVPTDAGCHVAIEHEFRPRIGVWAWFVDRLFVRPVARRTLASFKVIAEATAAATSEAPRSGRPKPAKNTS
jgi:ribosome-associated toxin RatA of RatAB toxin-antitoxin module